MFSALIPSYLNYKVNNTGKPLFSLGYGDQILILFTWFLYLTILAFLKLNFLNRIACTYNEKVLF